MGWTDESDLAGAWGEGAIPKWGDSGIWWGIANLLWGIGMTYRQGAWSDESTAAGAWSSE